MKWQLPVRNDLQCIFKRTAIENVQERPFSLSPASHRILCAPKTILFQLRDEESVLHFMVCGKLKAMAVVDDVITRVMTDLQMWCPVCVCVCVQICRCMSGSWKQMWMRESHQVDWPIPWHPQLQDRDSHCHNHTECAATRLARSGLPARLRPGNPGCSYGSPLVVVIRHSFFVIWKQQAAYILFVLGWSVIKHSVCCILMCSCFRCKAVVFPPFLSVGFVGCC